ncbi:hypothetical protein [uncultured Arcticibacterium sp.]|uniref:hypothetical protein n=1 Tax=uncultured Arcticibacterium sp. TaxID=2173042 RepID=UPI0030F4C7E7
MSISNFRTVSFCIFCLSLTAFCHGQDSTKTLKSERYFYKGKLFKADYYNENGQRTLSWENDVGVYRHASNHLTFNSYDDPNIDRLSTRYYVKVKDEKTVKFLKESGKPDGIILATKTDSIIDREYTEKYLFQVAKNHKKYFINELSKPYFVSKFDKFDIRPCKEIIDSTQTRRIYRTDYEGDTKHFEDYTYDTLGNFIRGSSEIFYTGNKAVTEYIAKENSMLTIFKTFQLLPTENKLVSQQENITFYDDKKQHIKREFYRINIKTKKKLDERIEYKYFGDKLEKQTITRGRKKYVVEISRAYW